MTDEQTDRIIELLERLVILAETYFDDEISDDSRPSAFTSLADKIREHNLDIMVISPLSLDGKPE